MKKFLFLIVLLSYVTISYAQNSLLATLNHEGTVSTFYGISALRDAHSKAVHGDVITLSSGTFNSVDITKAITLRGAGMEYDSLTTTEPTIINGDFNIQIPNDSTLKNHTLIMEGIYNNYIITIASNLYNPQFVKCNFYRIGSKNQSSNSLGFRNASFINCIISDFVRITTDCSATLVNSFVADPIQLSSSYSVFEFQNCVINFNNINGSSYDNYVYKLSNSIFRNCFINCRNSSSSYYYYNTLDPSCTAYNCVGYSHKNNIFNNQINTTNTNVSSVSEVFKTWQGENLNTFKTERLELADAAKAKYLGVDGTQIGIYGGSIPFEARPSNPQITKLNVASKSTADGKLSVDIEVKAAE